MITRDEILRRARAVPQQSDDYSQARLDGDGANAAYRPDCSGWVSYCWACPTSGPGTWGGYSTSTFITQGVMVEIPRSELQPGDAIGYCTPTSAGNTGHIALWLGKGPGGTERILDHGSGWGPLDHYVTWGVGTGWNAAGKIKAYRFRGVTSGEGFLNVLTEAQQADVWRRSGSTQRAVFERVVPALDSLVASAAAEATRDALMATAIKALAGGTTGDAAPIVAAIREESERTRGAVTALQQQLAAAEAERDELRVQLASALMPKD